MALELDELQSLTQDYWYPQAFDNYFTSNALTYRMIREGKKLSGGKKIRVPIYYGGPHGGAFGVNSTFDTSRFEDHNAARFDWAMYYEPVSYNIKDKIENSGEAAEVDLIMNKLKMAQKGIRDSMAAGVYGDGTGVAGTDNITGLRAMINATSSRAYGTISEDDLSEWKPGAVTTTTESLTLPVMRTLRTACEFGDGPEDTPTLFITTKTLLDTFRGLLQPQQRFSDPDIAKAGFRNIEFESVPVLGDGKANSGFMYALNENWMDFQSHQDFFFHNEPWMRPTDAYKFTMQLIWVGNIVCLRRDAHGYHSNLS